MSNVLLISYYFPPIGGAGAQRPVKFARYLLEQGHTMTVLTGSGHTGGLWTPPDTTLVSDLPPEVEVIRVPGPEPASGDALRNRLGRIARRPSDWSRWWQNGIMELGNDLRSIDAIYTIMSPYSSAEPSRELARSLGIGWIADLGDPWALDEMILYPTGVHRRLELKRMGRLLSSAAAVVMSTPEAVRQVVAEFPELEGRPVVAITNGYDEADFEEEPAPRDPTRFRIVHTGYLHTELGLQQRQRAWARRLLGGGVPGVDILTRSHVFLLEAVERLLAHDPSLRDRLEVHFAGVLSETDRQLAAASPVSVLHGYLSHADSIALMRSADLLFLPMQNLPPGRRSSTVPGKTYEYLASGRPILAAVPPGDARDFLEQSGRALLCSPGDVSGLADAIARALRGEVATPSDDPITARFAYDRLAEDVAAVVDEAVIRSIPDRTPADGRARLRKQQYPLHVLLIAYHFPPIGGAGAQRSLKFARYLPEQGCRVTVVTGPGSETSRWTPIDDALIEEIPEGTTILRVPGPEPTVSGWGARLQRWLRVPSPRSRWWIDGVLQSAGGLGDIDVVLASASPYDSIEAGAELARRLGKPWVAGLRDPWALDEMILYPTGMHRRLELAYMRRLLRTASAVVMNTPEAVRQVVAEFPELEGRPVVAITNGYDEADFEEEPAPRDPTRFRIVHTGYLHTELGLQQRQRAWARRLLGGSVPGVDILTRSHVFLLEAVERLLAHDPSLRDRLEVHFAGVLSETDRQLAAASPVSVLHGYLSHADSIALMRSADLLFLPMQNLPPGRRSSTVPGKTYEYLASGRPILAAVPPGDARDTILAAGHRVCDPDDTNAIAETIASYMSGEQAEVNVELVRSFERRELTRQLADVLRVVSPDAAPAPSIPVA